MNTLHIIIKEFKQNLRDWKANAMMVLLPIVLIIILAAAFSGIFDRTIKLNNVNVLYTIQSGEALTTGFKMFTEGLKKDMGISFTETTDVEEGMRSVKDVKYSCYIFISKDPEEIKVYKNARFNFEANLMESALNTFADMYSARSVIARTNPAAMGEIMAGAAKDFVKTESLDRKRQPGSLDYYAVTMLTLILMYASMTGLWAIKGEQNGKTGMRILSSPVTKYELLVGKVLGSILVTVVQASIVVIFSKFILKAYWGTDIATVMLIVLAESIMAISIGTGVAYLIRNDGAASGVLNTIIPIFVFLGGGYVPLSELSGTLLKITDVSPVKWVNDAIFRVIYDNDYSRVSGAIIINLAVAALFIVIASVLSKKEVA